ncbi:hypothetical protein P7M07_11145 [Vibrio parahaemolyticus]|nr:hypothetical protein [Vibrio parahaemolyticus]MDG2673568.1 hypothetical protein [Vibrio parahaemolyticus]
MSDEKDSKNLPTKTKATGSTICRKVPQEIKKDFKEEVKKIARKHGLRVNFIQVK